MRRKLLFSFCFLLLLCLQSLAQTITVTGKVTDEKGSPIPGASVIIKGTHKGTVTNANGSFSLSTNQGTHFIVSSVGYEDIDVAAAPGMTVVLTSDARSMADVVVTGVGVATSKKRVSIDVASVSSKDFAKSTTTSIEQGLQGQIAGAQIQQTSGQPGAGFNIILRGINSLGSTNPLILLDGVEVTDLSSLDPANVDRIEVVKGAAGGTLYGAQGANGVIQIFTKKGALNSKLNINFSSKVSIDNVLHGHDILAKFHHYVTDANGNILDASGRIISRDATGQWADPAVPDPSTHPEVVNNKTYNIPTYDHLDQAFRQALTTTNSLSLSGGSQNIDYAFVVSRLDQQDVFSNKFSRTNFSSNLGFQLFKGFTLRSNTQVIVGKNDLLNGNRFAVLNAYPWVDLNWLDSTGHRAIKTSAASNQNNSLSEQEWHQRNNQTLELVQNFNANYKFNRFVELDFKYGINYHTTDAYNYYLNQTAALQSSLHWGPDRQGSITDSYLTDTYKNALSTIYLKTDFQRDFHSRLPIRTVTQVSYDWRKDNYRSYYTQGVQLPTYPPANISVANTKTGGDYSSAFTTFGVLLNQTIDFGNLVGISAGFRSDYSSEFGAASKPFTFPRGTIYFRPSELLHSQLLTDWKLRAAYGEAGIQPDRYQRQVTFDVQTLGTGGVGLSLPTVASNPNLRVQISKELEVGTDLTINPFRGGEWLSRVTFSGTYWSRKSEDIIQQANVAPSSGFNNQVDNLTSISSKGVDLSLDATMFNAANVVWNMGIRFGSSKSRIDKIANNLDVIVGEFALKPGEELGIFYGQTPLHSVDQINPNTKTAYIPQAQRGNYTLVNGMVVDTRTNGVVLTAANDLSVLGKAYPDFTGSLLNNVTLFHNLTVSFQFDWVHGNNIYNMTRQWLYSPAGGSGGSGGVSSDFDNPVTINGQTGAFVNFYQSLYNLVKPTSWFIENGSFVRLRDASITYDFTRMIRLGWVKRLSATVAGRNLLTFTKYTGLDPENTTSVDTQGNQLNGIGAFKGVDYFGIPNLRSFQFSVNIGF
ncbi:MAG: SusC/RagA family TonB-linked outer membrane protein [Flavisolibacter sp.]